MEKVETFGSAGWRSLNPEDLDGRAEYRKTTTVPAVKMGTTFRCHTPEGIMTGEPGDYLCGPGAEGEFWPVKASIFEATYERVN